MVSALPLRADIAQQSPHVRFVPISDIDSITTVRSGGRDRKLKESTLRFAPGPPQPSAVGFDNRAADRTAHAHAVRLPPVEGLKATRQVLPPPPIARTPHPP